MQGCPETGRGLPIRRVYGETQYTLSPKQRNPLPVLYKTDGTEKRCEAL